MRYIAYFCLLVVPGLLGCETRSAPPKRSTQTSADNSAVNQRDAEGETKTPFDQGGSAADREMTAKIRRRVVDLPDVSLNAQNVKIITNDGQVTLRGPVASEKEREMITRIATEVAGEGHVDNQLEVAAP